MKAKQVSVEYVKYLKNEIHKINKLPFDKIEWVEFGVPVTIPEQRKKDFEYTGLNNTDFIMSGYYKAPTTKE